MNTESFTFLCRTKTGFGMNALDHLPFDLSSMGAKKPFVLQDQEADSSGCIKPLACAFMDSDMILGVCPPMNRNIEPGMDMLKDCCQMFINKGFDSIIALGTGKTVDFAKALNLAVSFGPDILKPGILNNEINQTSDVQPLMPFAFLPTGTGTGMETDCTARFNRQVFDLPAIAPDIALINEKIMAPEMPDNIINSVLTCLSVCSETQVLSKNPLAKAYAATGIGLIINHLFPLIAQVSYWDSTFVPDGKNTRYHLACLAHASAITGYLLANNKSLISFHLGNFIAGKYNSPGKKLTPGQAMAIILPHVLELFACDTHEFGDLLLSLCSQDEFSTIPLNRQQGAAVYNLHSILNKLYGLSFGAVPRTLADAGIEKEAIDSLPERFFQEKNCDITGIPGIDTDKIKSVLIQSLNGQSLYNQPV